MDIGAKVWRLAMNSAVHGPTDENGCGEWLHSGEFIKLKDYETALKRILELESEIADYRNAWENEIEENLEKDKLISDLDNDVYWLKNADEY